MRVFILGYSARPGLAETIDKLLPELRRRCDIVLLDLAQEQDLTRHEADLALVFGGDGAILRAAHQMGYRQRPVLGVNLGRLGFLADVRPDELLPQVDCVLRGDYVISKHLMYECEVAGPESSRTFLGLNEIVVYGGPPFHIIEVEVRVDDELISSFRGDGFILSTPIGSTAHNLSAGGPILQQNLQAFVLTLICPHMLTNRSLVDRADGTYEIRVLKGTPSTTLIIDGQEHVHLTADHRVLVRRAPVEFQLVKVTGGSYYRTLRDKLNWGAPPNYGG
jgi:NAD+ kinase